MATWNIYKKEEELNVKRRLYYGKNKEHINKRRRENCVQVIKDVVDSQGHPLKLKSVVSGLTWICLT